MINFSTKDVEFIDFVPIIRHENGLSLRLCPGTAFSFLGSALSHGLSYFAKALCALAVVLATCYIGMLY